MTSTEIYLTPVAVEVVGRKLDGWRFTDPRTMNDGKVFLTRPENVLTFVGALVPNINDAGLVSYTCEDLSFTLSPSCYFAIIQGE